MAKNRSNHKRLNIANFRLIVNIVIVSRVRKRVVNSNDLFCLFNVTSDADPSRDHYLRSLFTLFAWLAVQQLVSCELFSLQRFLE